MKTTIYLLYSYSPNSFVIGPDAKDENRFKGIRTKKEDAEKWVKENTNVFRLAWYETGEIDKESLEQ